MSWQYIPYILALSVAATVSVSLALLIWRRRAVSRAVPLVWLALAMAVWSLGYALELGGTEFKLKVFWARVEYVGIVAVPVLWFVLGLHYSGREEWLKRRNLAALAIVPCITLLLVWTNESHHLIWDQVTIDRDGLFSVLDLTYGIWFWIHATYSYLLVLLGTLLILQTMFRSSHLYRGQAGVLVIGVLMPWVGNMLGLISLFGLIPSLRVDLTPFAFTLSGPAVMWGLFRFRLFDIVPVARDAVVEGMSDGVIVVDTQERIVDLNPVAQRIFGCSNVETIGQPIVGLLSVWFDLLKRRCDTEKVREEIVLGQGQARRTFDLYIEPLENRRGRLTGRLVVLRDITERKSMEEELRRHRDHLEELVAGRTAELARTNTQLQHQITERERAEREIRLHAETLSALHETALDLVARRSWPDLLQAIALRAVSLLKAKGAGVYIYRSATDDLEMVVSDDPESASLGDVLQRGQGLPGKVLETGQSMVIDDCSGREGYTFRHGRSDPAACAAVPISWGGHLLGVLSVVDDKPRAFSLKDIALLARFSPLAAAALEQTRLLEEAQVGWREAETLRQASAAVTETLSLDETLARILEQLNRVVPYDSASIQLLRDGCMEIVSGRGFPEPEAVIGFTFPIPEDNPNTVVVESRQPFILADARAKHVPFRESPHNHIRSWLGVPLIVRDRVIGMLAVDSTELGHFDRQHVRLVIPFANQAAIAIENARLVEGLEAEVAARTAEIVAEQEKSETILRSVADAIAMIDLETQIQYVNDAFISLTGYSTEEVIGQRHVSLLTGEEMPELSDHSLRLALDRGEMWQGEVTIGRKDGRKYDAALTITPVREAEGRLVGYVSSHRDISRIKELEKARRQFITNVSHELRTPVSNLKLFAQLLQMGRRPERTEHYLHVLVEQADRLAALIQGILEMTELDSGRVVTAWEPVSLSTVVMDAVTRYRGRAEKSGLTLVGESVPTDLPLVKGDQGRLTQALSQLVENAVIFTPEGGQVVLETGMVKEEGQHWVTIAVCDTGPGISLEEQERVFDRFYRGILAQSGHIPGTGLGLSIAQEIVRAHGGRVTVESQVGQGSTFTLWLRSEA